MAYLLAIVNVYGHGVTSGKRRHFKQPSWIFAPCRQTFGAA